MQNGAIKSAAIALRFRAMPDSEICRWPNPTQDAISEVQHYSPCFSANMSSGKDLINLAGRPAAPAENSSPSPIPSSDLRCSARNFSENRKTVHTVWNSTARSSAGLGNGAFYTQRSRNPAGTEISDFKESLLTSSHEMLSQSEPTVNEEFSFPWSNSTEILINLENTVGFDKQNLSSQQEVPTSLTMDRLTNDGNLVKGIDVAWSTSLPYCSAVPLNINVDNGFLAHLEETTDNARKAELTSLLNANNDKVLLQVFSADRLPYQATSKTSSQPIADSFEKGNCPRLIKMDDIASSNNVMPSTLTHITCPIPVCFQSSNILAVHANLDNMDLLYSVRNKVATVQRQHSSCTVNDSASASSSSNHRLKSTRRADKNEETATEQMKRTCSVLENGDPPAIANRNAFKKARIMPGASTLSASLKVQVRKVKLGERITALQQLVSPFGKTDTASVLLEAIGYIRFLQEQVQVLSAPYLKAINSCGKIRDGREETKCDLRSRGLCLVPVSFTAHVANHNGADFWTSGKGSGSQF